MQIEVWKDDNGYRIDLEDPSFELTHEAFTSLIAILDDCRAMEEPYKVIMLDLEESE